MYGDLNCKEQRFSANFPFARASRLKWGINTSLRGASYPEFGCRTAWPRRPQGPVQIQKAVPGNNIRAPLFVFEQASDYLSNRCKS
jgi:hypothetical protein